MQKSLNSLIMIDIINHNIFGENKDRRGVGE